MVKMIWLCERDGTKFRDERVDIGGRSVTVCEDNAVAHNGDLWAVGAAEPGAG